MQCLRVLNSASHVEQEMLVIQTVSSAIVIIPLLLASMTLLPLLWLGRVIRMSFFRFCALSAFIVYALAVVHVTMFPLNIVPASMRSDDLVSSSINLVPFSNAGEVSFALNVVMMMPFGFLLPLVSRRLASLKSITIAGFLTSVAIEGMQLLMLVTLGNRRIVDIDDLIANTGGTIIGYVAFVAMFGVATTIVREVGRIPAQAKPRTRLEPIHRQF